MTLSTFNRTRFTLTASLPVPTVAEFTLSGRLLNLASYMAKREVKFKLTSTVSAGLTKNDEVDPVWIMESFTSRVLAVNVQLRKGFKVKVLLTVIWELPLTVLVSLIVSGGVVLEIPVMINFDKLMAAALPNAPTLPSTKEDFRTPNCWFCASLLVPEAGELPHAERLRMANNPRVMDIPRAGFFIAGWLSCALIWRFHQLAYELANLDVNEISDRQERGCLSIAK